MTQLSTVSNLVKKYAWVVIIALIILISLFLIYLKFIATQKPDLPSPIEKPSFGNLNVDIGQVGTNELEVPTNIPETLPVFQKINSTITNATGIAKKLGLDNQPQTVSDINFGEGLLYSNNNGALAVYPNQLTYMNYTKADKNAGFKNTEDLKTAATNFISSLGLSTDFSEVYDVFYYQEVGEFFAETENIEDASFVTLNFYFSIQQTRVVDPQAAVSVTFDRTNNLTRLVYSEFNTGQQTGDFPIRSPKEALGQLISTGGALINISSPNDYTPPPKKLDSIELIDISLVYYTDSNQSTIQPVWLFKGKGNIEEGKTRLVFGVPAIQEKYLKP